MQKKGRELQHPNTNEIDSSLGKYNFLKLTQKKEKISGLFYRKRRERSQDGIKEFHRRILPEPQRTDSNANHFRAWRKEGSVQCFLIKPVKQ